MPAPAIADRLLRAAKQLRKSVGRLVFGQPVTHIYNPLSYAWPLYEAYVRKFASTPKRIVFLGMNPGPFGMVQTGVPFGQVATVRDWLRLEGKVAKPRWEHPRRPVTGLGCARSEVSGRRLWGLFADQFGSPEAFFAEHLVMNYCPLAFLEQSGRNRTPDKLPSEERSALFAACDAHLLEIVRILNPEWLIAVGGFAHRRAQQLFTTSAPRLGCILHPSPASPAANRDWANAAARQLEALGVWPRRHAARSLQPSRLRSAPSACPATPLASVHGRALRFGRA